MPDVIKFNAGTFTLIPNETVLEPPLTVSKVVLPDAGLKQLKNGAYPVRVKPLAPKYEGKTYLGFMLGDVSGGSFMRHTDEGELIISLMHNPCMFVPELRKCIFGCESFWSPIKSEDELREITDEEIANTWYVKALREREEAFAKLDSEDSGEGEEQV
jgi:hypothetical protein